MSKPLDAALAAINAAETPDTTLIAAKCRGLLRGYHARWESQNHTMVPTQVERLYYAPLFNPATGHKSKSLMIAGKLDLVVERANRKVLWDHKGASEDIEDPMGNYWKTVAVESQFCHYMYLSWLNGEKLDEALYDVLRRPSISPRQFKSKAEKASAVGLGEWFGVKLSPATMDYLQTSDAENCEMFEARLTNDCTVVRPAWYFQRRTFPKLDSEIQEHAKELWIAGQLILNARKAGLWPKHPYSCMNYGRACTYLGVCSGYSNFEDGTWQQREKIHSELTEKQDRNTLTYSSIRTFQSCPRKFQYRYEIGIEKVQDEDSDALRIGTLLHTALEAFWDALVPKENCNGNSDTDPVNSTGYDRSQASCAW